MSQHRVASSGRSPFFAERNQQQAVWSMSHIWLRNLPMSGVNWPTKKENIMYSGAIKTLVICTFGAAVITGCASSHTSPSPSVPSFASSQSGGAQRGQIAAVEIASAVDQTTRGTSSGSSTVTSASGGPEIITVNFADGSEGRYQITEQAAPLKVGQPVSVVRTGNGFTIFSP